jgi:sigma-E factor negative regulatory protein RseA
MEQMQTQELISALADGQLQGESFARGVEVALSDPAAREAWAAYHLIGDVLRSGELAVASEPVAFVARLRGRLQAEDPIVGRTRHEAGAVVAPRREAANDTSFRWKIVAGLASVAAVSAVAWSVGIGLGGNPEASQIAKAGAGAVLTSAGERGVMIRDPQLDELLAAHRRLRGPSALQMSAGFVRNATFESTGR